MNPQRRRLITAIAVATAVCSLRADDSRPLKPLALDDALAWKSIASPAVSNDGRWFGYRLSPVQGDGEIVIRSTQGDKELRFSAGEQPLRSDDFSGPPPPPPKLVAFSDDSSFAAFTVYPTAKDARQLRRQNRLLQNNVVLVNLATGEKTEFDRVKRFAFAGERGWIALHRYGPADGPPAAAPGAGPAANPRGPRQPERPRGSDLILRDLKTGAEQNIGNVSEFAFDKSGHHLAWTIDAQDKIGNSIVVRNMDTGVVATIDSDKATYERPSWTEKGDAFAVLKSVDDKKYRDKPTTLVAERDVDAAQPVKIAFAPGADVPAGFTISPSRTPVWTEDLSAILFGIHQMRTAPPGGDREAANGGDRAPDRAASSADEPELPTLTLWHYLDPRLQSQQQVQENRDRSFSYLAEYRVAEKKFIRLADDGLRDVQSGGRSPWAIGRDAREYELEGSLDGRRYEDVYAVSLATGARTLIAKKIRWAFAPSPDESKFLYYNDAQFFVYDIASGRTTNITKGAPVEFWDADEDTNVIKPPVRPIGWTSGSDAVLLSDGWDIWKAPAAGGTLVNLTVNGRPQAIRYRSRYRLDPDERGIDLAAGVYVEAYGEWTKKQGIARLDAGRPGVTQLTWDDATTEHLLKPAKADALLFTRETSRDFPDYYVADRDLKRARRITDANPQQKEFAWSAGARLVNYTSAKGDKLQGGLYLPANYEKGKSYPTIVYIYERLSQNLNHYPSVFRGNGFAEALYTSNGYAVLEPDIKYRVNDPGMSAVWSVVPAVKAAIATGVVDAAKVGLQGHSWGGYQTAFLVTQTDTFAAAVAGAPLTDMISMYSLIYKNTGVTNQAIFESSQGRFYGGYWDNLEAYMRNSPVFHAKNVHTPLMILHNDRDGAVDFTQGVEYFNTLRRLGKPVVMLEYVGENHGVRRPVNQQDYTVRMKEFFDHYLMGRPAPDWLAHGVPRLKMEEHLRERQQQRKAPTPVKTTTESGRP